MENNALAFLQTNPTKAAIMEVADQFVAAIENGNMSAIDVAINMTALETLVKELRSGSRRRSLPICMHTQNKRRTLGAHRFQ